MAEAKEINLRYYRAKNGRSPFIEWNEALDLVTEARVSARLARVREGNLGDHRALQGGIHELRFSFAPGFRIYFAWEGTLHPAPALRGRQGLPTRRH